MPRLCFPVPPTSSQTLLESTIPICREQFSPEMSLPNLYTSKVLDITTAHKTHRFQGDYCPIWELQPLPTALIHTAWQGTGGSSFLRPPTGLVPNSWLNVNKLAQCKTIPISLRSQTCQLPVCFLLPCSASGISYWPHKTHPLSTWGPGGACGAAPSHCALFCAFIRDE